MFRTRCVGLPAVVSSLRVTRAVAGWKVSASSIIRLAIERGGDPARSPAPCRREPGGSARCYWNRYGTQCGHPGSKNVTADSARSSSASPATRRGDPDRASAVPSKLFPSSNPAAMPAYMTTIRGGQGHLVGEQFTFAAWTVVAHRRRRRRRRAVAGRRGAQVPRQLGCLPQPPPQPDVLLLRGPAPLLPLQALPPGRLASASGELGQRDRPRPPRGFVPAPRRRRVLLGAEARPARHVPVDGVRRFPAGATGRPHQPRRDSPPAAEGFFGGGVRRRPACDQTAARGRANGGPETARRPAARVVALLARQHVLLGPAAPPVAVAGLVPPDRVNAGALMRCPQHRVE